MQRLDIAKNGPSKHRCEALLSWRRGLSILLPLFLGCSGFDGPEPVPMAYGTMTDARDGQVYRTVTVASMTWMQQELNFVAPESECPDTVSTCGRRLYSWSTAMGVEARFDTVLLGVDNGFRKGICPTGWHLPSIAEWRQLKQIMNPSGIDGNWASNDRTGFDLRGWDQSGSTYKGWYWSMDEVGIRMAQYVISRVSYDMIGPSGFLYIQPSDSAPKGSKFGIRCLFDGTK